MLRIELHIIKRMVFITIKAYLYRTIQNLTMKNSFSHLLFFVFVLLLGISSCTDSATSNNNNETSNEQTTLDDNIIDLTPSLSSPDCVIQGQVLKDNTLWIAEIDVLAVIKADTSTTQEGFEPSHRIFELLNGRTCEVAFSEMLPENASPDFPYYIAQIQYNKDSKIIGIQGFYDIYICDLDQDNQLTKLSPKYFKERLFDDPQSGMIMRLEVWEDYLLGYAQDAGAFAFDISDKSSPKSVLAFAEWQDPENADYHSMFLLPTADGTQAIIPFYDAEEDDFILHPIFNSPQNFSTNIPKTARNNKFLVLRDADDQNKSFAIDLNKRALVDLPDNVAGLKTQQILDWMRKQD